MERLIPLRLKPSFDEIAPPVPPRSERRQHSQPPPTNESLAFPCTQVEWMVIMDEIKGLYLKRQYKLCSARCIEVLKNIKDPYRVHPLHAIYLSFYVASSLELTARALHVNSSNKLPLLQESLHYYKNAESSMEFASFSANPSVDRAARQRSCSIASSIRSSVDSVFTHSGSTSSSALPSPTASLCDPNSDNEQSNTNTHHPHRKTSGQLRMKKKVSFSTRDHIAITDPESSDDETALIDAFPQPPRSTTPTQERESDASISEFLLSRSLARYSAHLSDFQIQIAYHIGSVNAQIHTVQTCRKARRSNLPDLFTTDFGSGGLNGVDKMEFKKVELKARIGKLKEAGWKRERFDGVKYQLLAEKALGELEE